MITTDCGCGGKALETRIVDVVRWGRDQHEFLMPYNFFRCPNCGDEFFDIRFARAQERTLNFLIKKKIGIDWLKENRKLRRKEPLNPKN